MFTPKMSYLLVLVGDEAIKEVEHTLSSLRDHVKTSHHPMLEVLCLVDDINTHQPVQADNGIHVSYYQLNDLLQNNSFGTLIMQKRAGINSRIPGDILLEVKTDFLGLAFVVRGTQVSSESIFALYQQAKHIINALHSQMYCQLCYLTEDEPAKYSRQADWLRDPEEPKKIKSGFFAFNDFLLLSARQETGYDGVEVEHQQKEAFPLGLLALLSQPAGSQETRLSTMRFGKINGSSYEIRQLIQHITAHRLENWAREPMDSWTAWELLSNQELPLNRDYTLNDAKDMLLHALEEGLRLNLPVLEDLACVGLLNSDVDMQAVVLSFNELNEGRFLNNDASKLWAERWYKEVLGRIDDQVHIDPLIEYLADDGLIGRTISVAKVEARRASSAITNSETWLRNSWQNAIQPNKKLFEPYPQYHYRCLAGLQPALYELWKTRGIAARLEALDEQRQILRKELMQWVSRRKAVLEKYHLTNEEMQVLSRTCASYMEEAQSIADHYAIEDLPQFDDLMMELYHSDKIEKVWQSLFDRFIKNAFIYQTSYADALVKNSTPSGLISTIQNYNRYNDGVLLPQLPLNAKIRSTVIYPIAEKVYEALQGHRIPGAQIVSIPGDLIEKMTLVFLGGIEQLTELHIFKNFDFTAAPSPLAVNQAQPLKSPVQLHQEQALDNSFSAKLISDNNDWWLYWDWVGPQDEPAMLTWNGHQASVKHSIWSDRGQRFNLSAARVPYGQFSLELRCGSFRGETLLEGKRLKISLRQETMKGMIKVPDGIDLIKAQLQISGETALAAEKCLLKNGKHANAFVYDIFAFSDPSISPALGPIYTSQPDGLILEGKGKMEGFVLIDQMGEW